MEPPEPPGLKGSSPALPSKGITYTQSEPISRGLYTNRDFINFLHDLGEIFKGTLEPNRDMTGDHSRAVPASCFKSGM